MRHRSGGLIFGGVYFRNFTEGEKRTINLKAHTTRAELVCLLIEPIFVFVVLITTTTSLLHLNIITSLSLLSQELFTLVHFTREEQLSHPF